MSLSIWVIDDEQRADSFQIRIALPGYQTFETDIDPLANQKVEIKSDLVKNGAPLADPLINTEAPATRPPVAQNTAPSPQH